VTVEFIAGGALFGVAFVVGGLASYRNIRNSRGPRERKYVLRMCGLSWLVILSMLCCAYALTAPLLYYVMAAYFIVTPVLFYRWTTTHQLIRELERRESNDKASA
jgi:amino acid transporter